VYFNDFDDNECVGYTFRYTYPFLPMCGIVGYIGTTEARPVLLDGLRRLEYRGYDSAGLAVWDGQKINLAKIKGRVADLAGLLQQQSVKGTVGIAHTRWATHGEPTTANAHPHADCKNNVYVVHNGIVENYKALKDQLIREGHTFHSETDTEILSHLIEKYLTGATTLEQAVSRALKFVKGTYALLAIASSDPEKIVAARLSSPLRIGVSADQVFIASDPSALLNYTSRVVTLTDGELAVITRGNYTITSLEDGGAINREAETIDWNIDEIQKSGFDHFMLKEIFEQPETVINSTRGRLIPAEGRAVLGGLADVEDKLRALKRLTIVACGTASYAGLVGEYMLEEYADLPVEVCVASEFRYRKPSLIPREDAVLVISQSGETADTLAAVREAKAKGVLTLGIVNVIGSTISRETDAGVYNHAGPEISVCSTKVFMSQLTVLALLTLLLGRQRRMSLVTGQRIAAELAALPARMAELLAQADRIKTVAQHCQSAKNFFFCGRKYNYPIALEGALKLKEISYRHAEGLAAGELKHGPLAMVDEHFPVIFICPKDSVYEKNISNIQEVKARRGRVIAIATAGDTDIAAIADDVIYIPKTLEMLTPLLAVVPLQLFAYYIAQSLGVDIDKPRNLAKSVTVE